MNGEKSTEQHLGKPKHKCLHKQVGKNGGDSASQHPKGTHKGDKEHLLRVWSMELQERRAISKKQVLKALLRVLLYKVLCPHLSKKSIYHK